MKTFVPLATLVLAFSLACSGGTDAAVDHAETPPPDPAAVAPVAADATPGQEVVVVPVPIDGTGTNWCCQYTEDGSTKHALTDGKAACESTYATKGATWVDGASCTPCCCKSPNDEGNLDLGYTFAVTTPGACAGSGECVPMGDDTCATDEKKDAEPVKKAAPKPTSGHVETSRPQTRPMTPTKDKN